MRHRLGNVRRDEWRAIAGARTDIVRISNAVNVAVGVADLVACRGLLGTAVAFIAVGHAHDGGTVIGNTGGLAVAITLICVGVIFCQTIRTRVAAEVCEGVGKGGGRSRNGEHEVARRHHVGLLL